MKAQVRRFQIPSLLLLTSIVLMPGVAVAAEEGSKWGMLLPVGRLFNLALVVGVVVWVARKPLANFYATRTQTIREQLAEAQAAKKEAEAKLAEMESHMQSLDDELAKIKAQAESEAQEEYRRLLADAERDAAKIVERAREEIEGMTRAAQLELKAHVAELSVQMAEENIRQEITNDDRDRLFTGFVTKLGGEK
ncbi:MAG TPA: ATP synthase F0 subunit B [Acidobacteriota bacterium]|nr:ATP synthase F0 subunit B [Acidobacteriota bacterium]